MPHFYVRQNTPPTEWHISSNNSHVPICGQPFDESKRIYHGKRVSWVDSSLSISDDGLCQMCRYTYFKWLINRIYEVMQQSDKDE